MRNVQNAKRRLLFVWVGLESFMPVQLTLNVIIQNNTVKLLAFPVRNAVGILLLNIPKPGKPSMVAVTTPSVILPLGQNRKLKTNHKY